MRLVRMIALIALSSWSACQPALVKRSLPSRGDPSSDEVAVFDGIALESRSSAFRVGSMLSWFGGIAIRVPPGWRIESDVKALVGVLAIGVPEVDDRDSPTLTLDGFAMSGGVAVDAKPVAAEPES